ncbi:MAG: hypothetical protein ABIW94_01845, partial [Gemmatimonadaceae bacterium]
MHGTPSRGLRDRVIARKFALPLLVALLFSTACTRDSAGGRDSAFVVAISTDPGQLNTAITTNGSVHNAGGFLYNGLVALDDG